MADIKNDFEKNLKELEEVVRALEGGKVSLNEMLELFEKGVMLTKNCTEQLDKAEQKISILVKGANGEYTEEDFKAQKE